MKFTPSAGVALITSLASVAVWRNRVGLTDRGWRRGSLYKGDGEGILVHGEKEGRG
jgi:hypothetical protein